jgi:GNAT superfamily N-acetyltransferase
VIRPARLEDAPVVADLGTQLGYPTSPEQAETRLRDLLDRADHAVLVAEEAGAVIGWAHVAAMPHVVNDPFAELVALVIDENRRGRGTGAALVEAVSDWAARNGFRTLRVRSNVVRERAHRFYDRLGFERTKSQVVFAKSLDRAEIA